MPISGFGGNHCSLFFRALFSQFQSIADYEDYDYEDYDSDYDYDYKDYDSIVSSSPRSSGTTKSESNFAEFVKQYGRMVEILMVHAK